MKINPNNHSIPIEAYVNNVQDKKTTALPRDKAAHPGAKTDTVDISDTAKRVSADREEMDRIPDVREEKVAELKKQVENGSYQVDPEKIAEKMLKDGFLNDI
jgi:negative regulator of flagellin synthesis FlgM